MNTPAFDPLQYKAGQHHEWEVAAALWKPYWAIWEQAAQQVNERLIALAHVDTGQRVLDIATGLGEPACTAARRVGPTGWVVATDFSPQMLALAREEATRKGVHNIEFREMDAEEPDLPAHTFHAILCRWALMFLPQPRVVLDRLRRLLRPGGRLAVATWGPAPNAPGMSLPPAVARQVLHLPPPPPGRPGAFSLSDAHALEQLFRQAGFPEVSSEGLLVTFEYASAEEYIRERLAVGAAFRTAMAQAAAEDQARVWQALAEAVQPYAGADGKIRMPNETICVVGQSESP
jgi:enediyne biosynthesis protein CalE5